LSFELTNDSQTCYGGGDYYPHVMPYCVTVL
jgi:hypothetical protein